MNNISNIKLIVSDLDGTLLRSDKSVSDYTYNILEQCKSKGIKFVVATARPIRAVKNFLPQLFFDGATYHNGSVTYYANKELERMGIKNEDVKKILSDITKDFPDTKLSAEIGDHLYANFDASALWKGVAYTYTDFSDIPSIEADKIIIGVASINEIKIFERYLSKNLYIQMSENTIGMIMNKSATKIRGILRICTELGIQLSDVIAFGDDYNDIDMIKECKVGVAMANAIEDVKAEADYICDKNDNDGVAKWIDSHLL